MYAKCLFPIHIYQTNIGTNNILQQELLSKIEDLHNAGKLKVPEGWITDKLSTSFKYDDLNHHLFDNTQTLQTYIEYIPKFFDLEVEFIINNMWFNYYINGEWQEIHTHVMNNYFKTPTTFSCVHFLKYNPEIHTPLTFIDPIEHLRYSSLEMDIHRYESRYPLQIKEGDLVMFPSYLQHYVKPSKPTPDYPRITIAFNLQLLRYGNEKAD